MGEIIFVILLVGGMLGVSAWARQWWLFRVFLIFFICFGLVEWWAVASTGQTVSQHFWDYSAVNPVGAWIVIAGMGVAWLSLLWHFAAKHLLRRK